MRKVEEISLSLDHITWKQTLAKGKKRELIFGRALAENKGFK
jgi:hypothetical protein